MEVVNVDDVTSNDAIQKEQTSLKEKNKLECP